MVAVLALIIYRRRGRFGGNSVDRLWESACSEQGPFLGVLCCGTGPLWWHLLQ